MKTENENDHFELNRSSSSHHIPSGVALSALFVRPERQVWHASEKLDVDCPRFTIRRGIPHQVVSLIENHGTRLKDLIAPRTQQEESIFVAFCVVSLDIQYGSDDV